MSDSPSDATGIEMRAARRLARLFRIERRGALGRRAAALAARLVERRAALIAALVTADRERRVAAVRPGPELDRAMTELSREACLGLLDAQTRLQRIANDLRLSRGEGRPTGIRGNSDGRPLGKS
jgi:hypothetical protein